MNCKHLKIQGTTTKYFFCGAKQKAINEYECRSCPLKIEKEADLPKEKDWYAKYREELKKK